jgi:small subunit ribosomal protein S8
MNTDPIADMLTRIRNAQKAGHAELNVPASRIKLRIAEILSSEGFLGDVSLNTQAARRSLGIKLRYDKDRRPIIDGIQHVSSPGLRIYRGHSDLEHVRGGLGVSILSTSRGLMTDKEARQKKLGGEVLCNVW